MSTATRRTVASGVIASGLAMLLGVVAPPGVAAQAAKAPQKIDAEYTAKIKEVLQDPRIIDGARRSSAGVGHGAHPAQVPRADRRSAW